MSFPLSKKKMSFPVTLVSYIADVVNDTSIFLFLFPLTSLCFPRSEFYSVEKASSRGYDSELQRKVTRWKKGSKVAYTKAP